MAIASVQHIGWATMKATTSTLSISPSSKTVTAGNDVFVEATVNTSTGTGTFSGSDNLGNSYTQVCEGNGPNNTLGIRTVLLRGSVVTGGSITSIAVNGPSGTAWTGMAHELSGVGTLVNAPAGTVNSGGTTEIDVYPGGASGTQRAQVSGNLWIGGLGWKSSGVSLTMPSTVTGSVGSKSTTEVSTAGSSGGSNNGSCLVYFICTASTNNQLQGVISSSTGNASAGAEYAPAATAVTYLVPLHRQGPNFRR